MTVHSNNGAHRSRVSDSDHSQGIVSEPKEIKALATPAILFVFTLDILILRMFGMEILFLFEMSIVEKIECKDH